ncbi:MAG: YihY/virulence factor BrkB family protein [Nitrospirae bacterium]|nr:YihY/virulence factor BrkB family protein [Nitrospirota bacterium]
MRVIKVIGKSLLDFFRDDGLTLAAAMSYFTMMTIVPFSLFLITFFGHLLGNYPEFYKFFMERIASFFPSAAGEISRDLVKLISLKGLGKFSLLLYGLLSFQVFASLENSMNVIFKIKKRRHMFLSVMISLLVVTLIIVVIVVSFAAASVIPLITALKDFLPGIRISRVAAFIIRFVIPFAMLLVTLTSIYYILPRTRIKFADAFSGALFTTAFFEVAKHLFTWYVVSVVGLGMIYGPLTAFIVFLLWMFYSSSLVLIGAEMVHNLGISRERGRRT